MTEPELISRLKEKDAEAFRKLVDTWQGLVYNTVLGILMNVEDAEDVAQEVFIQVYESVNGFKGDSKISTWLYRIAISKSMDHIRKKKRKKRFAFIESLFNQNDELIHDPGHFVHPGVQLENKEAASDLFKAVSLLPNNQRTAFVLNKIEQLSYQEMAEVMGISVAAADSLLHRAKVNLRKLLNNYYLNHSKTK